MLRIYPCSTISHSLWMELGCDQCHLIRLQQAQSYCKQSSLCRDSTIQLEKENFHFWGPRLFEIGGPPGRFATTDVIQISITRSGVTDKGARLTPRQAKCKIWAPLVDILVFSMLQVVAFCVVRGVFVFFQLVQTSTTSRDLRHFLTFFCVLASGPPSTKLCPLAQTSSCATNYTYSLLSLNKLFQFINTLLYSEFPRYEEQKQSQ